MDCVVCTTMPLILRPPRNTICADCYEGAKSIINMMKKINSDKPVDNSNASPVSSSPKSSKPILEFKSFWLEQREILLGQSEELAFLRAFVNAFTSQIHTDILITPGKHGPPIPAHKAILATRSVILKNMLESDECKAEPNKSIIIPELEHEEVESLLEFLYCGNLSPHKWEKHVYALARAAHKYEIPYLERVCEKYMLSSLSVANALDVFEIADTCCLSSVLKDNTLNFLLNNIDDVVSSLRYEEFVHNNPHLTLHLTRELVLKVKTNTAFKLS